MPFKSNFREFYGVIIIVLLSTTLFMSLSPNMLPNVVLGSPDWLAGWGYRKSHVINSAAGAGTNYQVMITVHYGSGVDSGGDVYCNSHCRTDFGDVRFTAADGSTLLGYWMQSSVVSSNAVFWVKVADDLSSQARTIYVYYGKSDAVTASDGDDTFTLFQDSFLLGAPNSVSYLNVPTYDGSGQLAHHDIYYDPDGWRGHKYWMVMTPYPNGDATKENPSIVVSEDGQSWSVPGGLTNPFVPYPGSGRHNCDPDLVYNNDTDELWVYFLDALDGATSYVKLCKSSDGVTWSSPVTVVTVSDVANIVSPSVVKIGGNWYMWTVNTHGLGWSAPDTDVELRTSSDGTSWGSPSTVTGITPSGYNVWHFNVIYIPSLGEFWASLGSYKDGQQGDACDLFMAKSSDGTSWIVQNFLAIKKGGTGAWDSGGLYRSVFLYDFANAIFKVWYIGHTNGNTGIWRLGYTETNTISAFNKMLATSPFGAPNSVSYLNVPTYDGSGQLAHHDIYYDPDGWRGHKYWMVMTPYPNGDATKENPSIVVSEDGQSWSVPGGLTNPFVPYPGSGRHNCDPDLVYNNDTDELWVYFLDALDGATSYVKLCKSSDGVTWSSPVTVVTVSDVANIVSPSVVKIGGNWYMWTVNTHGLGWSAPDTDVELRTSSDGTSWGSPSIVTGFTPPGYNAWHPHVIYVESRSEFWALSACYQDGSTGSACDLFMAKSSNGIAWTAQTASVMTKGTWDSGGLYRAAFLYDDVNDIFKVWYIGHTNGNTGVWRLGYTETNTVSQFNKMPTEGWWHPWSGGVTRQAGNYLLQTTPADNTLEGIQTVNASFRAGTALYFKGYRGTGSAGTVLGSSKYGTDVNNDAVTFLAYATTLYARTRVGGSQTQNSMSLAGTAEGIYKIFWISGSSVKFYKDSTNVANHATNIPSGPLYVTIQNYDSGTILWTDWVFIRSYVSPEPNHASWGSEEQSQYVLTVNVVGAGSVNKNPDQVSYPYGTVVTLNASASVGWTFAGWSGAASGIANPTTVTMTGDKTVAATFLQASLHIDPQLTQKTLSDVGTTFKVNVTITDVIDLRGFDFNVTWDPSLLTLASVGFNSRLDEIWGSGNWVLAVNQSGAGYYKLVAVSTANSFNSTGPTSLARLEFLVQDPQSNQLRQSPIHFDTHKLSNSQYNAITHTITDGNYQITGIEPALQLSPTSKTCRKSGETFTVRVDMSNAYNVTDFEFELHYNTTLLDYAGVTWNAWGSGTITVNETSGYITGITSGLATSGAQTLVTIEFNATYYRVWKDESTVSGWKNNQTGTILIHWANLSYAGSPDLGYVRGGLDQINVGPDFAYTFSPIRGDIDNNGVVNVFDIRSVAYYYDQANETYDLNGDGIIDIFDLVVIASNFGYTYIP